MSLLFFCFSPFKLSFLYHTKSVIDLIGNNKRFIVRRSVTQILWDRDGGKSSLVRSANPNREFSLYIGVDEQTLTWLGSHRVSRSQTCPNRRDPL